MAISSRVSRQSVMNAGQMTLRFLTPSLASLSISKSVYGESHGSRSSLDWKETVTSFSSIPAYSLSVFAVE